MNAKSWITSDCDTLPQPHEVRVPREQEHEQEQEQEPTTAPEPADADVPEAERATFTWRDDEEFEALLKQVVAAGLGSEIQWIRLL